MSFWHSKGVSAKYLTGMVITSTIALSLYLRRVNSVHKKPFQRMSKTGYHSYKGAKPHAKRELKKTPKKPTTAKKPPRECGRPPAIVAIVVVR